MSTSGFLRRLIQLYHVDTLVMAGLDYIDWWGILQIQMALIALPFFGHSLLWADDDSDVSCIANSALSRRGVSHFTALGNQVVASLEQVLVIVGINSLDLVTQVQFSAGVICKILCS